MAMMGLIASAGVASATAGPERPKSPTEVHGKGLVRATGNVQIVDSGETATEGWVAFTGLGSGTVRDIRNTKPNERLTSVSAGGGQWEYGTLLDPDNGQKQCISNYHHSIVQHGSTAKMNGRSVKAIAEAARWSFAMEDAFTTATCYAYWHKS